MSLSRAPVFSCAHYFQAPATQARKAKKMCASKTECGREASGDEVEVCTLPFTHEYT